MTTPQKKELAKRYWAIKDAGTVEELVAEYGLSKPTFLKFANEFRPRNRKAPGGHQGLTDAADKTR